MNLDGFKNLIKKDVALVDFNAPWCSPCRVQKPIIREIRKKYKNKVSVVEINIDDEKKLASHFRIQSIPTLIFFQKGQETKRLVGLQSKAALIGNLNKFL